MGIFINIFLYLFFIINIIYCEYFLLYTYSSFKLLSFPNSEEMEEM